MTFLVTSTLLDVVAVAEFKLLWAFFSIVSQQQLLGMLKGQTIVSVLYLPKSKASKHGSLFSTSK